MKSKITLLAKLFVVWLMFFFTQRVLFYIHYSSDFEVPFSELLQLPYYSFILDVSSFTYLMGIPFILISLSLLDFTENWGKILLKISKVFIWTLAVITSILFSSELVSYTEWRSKLSSKIFVHFSTPSEIFRTSSGDFTWWFLFYLILQLVAFYFLFKLFIKKHTSGELPKKWSAKLTFFSTYLLVGTGLFILGVRGGFQQIPVSATSAYYSNSQITNDLSVNSVWNFIHMTFEYYKADLEQYYNNVPEKEAQLLVDELYNYKDSDSIRILKSTEPNIIFVTLESWSAQMIESLGGEEKITPHFNALCQEGVLFTNIYATSETSETGHTSIFSGYPTLPKVSMSTESAKCRQMPSLLKELPEYSSSYYFGGDLSYGNIGGYLTEIGFQRLSDEGDLQELTPKGKLGIHDGAMFPYYLEEIKSAQRPYIYGLFTQSTHAPYDMPYPTVSGYPKDNEGYVTSLRYADEQIKIFTEALKTLPDFENTIVVFVADHGKTNFVNTDIYDAEFFHIPVLFWGGAILENYRGTIIDKIGSQVDISKTLLNQMDLNTDEFKWSKDLLNPNVNEWAIFTTSFTYGIKTKDGYVNYHIIDDKIHRTSYSDSIMTQEELRNCQAVIESVFREFKSF